MVEGLNKYIPIIMKNTIKSIQGQIDKIRNSVEDRSGQINKIRNLVKDRQSWLAWITVNEVNGRKSTLRAKIKAASQEESLQK